ncbi:Sapep family Mn(2+)-dependent dipeptidase [Enterococcus caccae]|uniref:M20/M25/M40 family peptidase n=1 Tax=Enterococcus caccae ATCC BAA-1240 TaxID=1158612 RepID=R3WRH7_9ENTE|nr:Sapep family Mn(2+)-dependent dipeptidase [Enterococcus caccae]EOL49987.1 M20/M25/M40 family peptidase [Enterococcus caccae ATCC BAA-1240]EOT56327.1 M20/M25/M40 family peptidase [Enterococcus caccae ATCC BAA-1240]
METIRTRIKAAIQTNQQHFLEELTKIMEVPSVKGQAEVGAPFGKEPRRALETVLALAESYGFQTEIVNDAVGFAQYGNDPEYIGVVGHLDVVPAGNGWDFLPFSLSEQDGRLFGRGILDNKGPAFACLYGLKLLKELDIPLEKTVRVIFGTDEESGSADLPLYLAEEQPPIFGFTPDCKYPVVYGERGIVNIELITPFSEADLSALGAIEGDQAKDHVPDELIVDLKNGQHVEVIGKRAPTNAPELGVNAITLLAEKLMNEASLAESLKKYFKWVFDSLHEKHYGEGFNLALADEDSGKLILTPYELRKTDKELVLSIAIRYPVTFQEEEIIERVHAIVMAHTEVVIVRSMKGTNFPKDDPNVLALAEVYEKVTGLDGTPVTTTGATYARTMPNIVAFGPSFPGQKGIAHNKNEYMDLNDLLLNLEIYTLALYKLAAKK